MYTRGVKAATFDKATTQGHTCFFYTDAVDRFGVLAQYFKQGLDKNELCIFVTAESQDDTIHYFMNAGLDVSKPVKDKALRIFEMNSTYISNGRFVTEYMLNNVSNFIDNAKEKGYSGLRTAGE
ncbi:MEDS domain-containing protein, partial [Candidatus Parcubacteria bacterium]|nr:MEDS domain-containing protein [Candidatus Parcubacteria bacterium]